MGDVVILLGRHARASVPKNESIGTTFPDKSVRRFAKPSEAVFRPAKMLRRCHSEQPAASATSATLLPCNSAQRSIGCASDIMGATISTRNEKSQSKRFLVEMPAELACALRSRMGKKAKLSTPQMYLGQWLALKDIGPTRAAEIAGCSQGYISNIMRGAKTNINALYLFRLSEHMEITVNDFYREPLPTSQIERLGDYSQAAQKMLLNLKRRKA